MVCSRITVFGADLGGSDVPQATHNRYDVGPNASFAKLTVPSAVTHAAAARIQLICLKLATTLFGRL